MRDVGQDAGNYSEAQETRQASLKQREPRETAWEFAIQRVNRYCEDYDERAMLFPDEGHSPFIRRLLRRMRRFQHVPRRWGGGSFTLPTARIVEDPNDRQSHDSYFIQLADPRGFYPRRHPVKVARPRGGRRSIAAEPGSLMGRGDNGL
ncbi:MAG: DUF3800 domain-containing protein [Gemmatimonadaceae bacterium]